MKKFLYQDIDMVNSIIAQYEKGIITSYTRTTGNNDEIDKGVKTNLDLDANFTSKLLSVLNVGIDGGISGEITNNTLKTSSISELITKSIHDEAYDKAYSYIKPHKSALGDDTKDDYGNYIEIKRVFHFIDLEYIKSLFNNDSVKSLYSLSTQNSSTSNQQFTRDLTTILNFMNILENLLPFKRMLLSTDGYIIPLDEKYLRVNPNSIGFMYNGELTCTGLITNILLGKSDASYDSDIFSKIDEIKNTILREILPIDKEKSLCIVHPIGIYYDSND